ncbi:peptide ABC transporter substrate-binding protein [Virgibacillus sp. MSJ-26]|uniref:peptide ABC transporter substrate-binding protein n=1 Tax=Virgibacillus sp. MSJ-26 TaxID=2841522 RepID=UPI001C128794|nr:peptide ABC transporter substrate-binding protein [Virgibacillus sp. MSJ-26]MBU5465418.1 peptide ABC transporter substrate-binding protein [Virgibacillus sp. MSJ-26]
MNKRFRTLLLVITSVCFIMALAACSGGEDEQVATNESDDTTGEEQEQVLNLTRKSQIPTMDSSMATDEASFQFLGLSMEGLYRLGEDAEVKEGIAIDHEESDDGMQWTFNLRDDAKWSNGDPVTADDFVYAWKRAVDPETGSEYGPYMMNGVIKNAEDISKGDKDVDELGVTAEDDYTLVVDLEKPVPYFESLMTFGTFLPLNEDFIKEQGDDYAQTSDTLLYNGPFKIDEWESTSDSWIVVKNEDYWDADTVELEKLTYEVVKDVSTSVDLFETGKIDRTELNSDFVDQFASSEEYATRSKPVTYYLKLNQTRNEALENENIRAAISRAFDKQALADEILNDGSLAINGLIPEDFAPLPDGDGDIREANGDLVEYNVDEAKEYWEKGLEELGEDSIEVEFLGSDSDTSKIMNEYLVNQLESNLDGLDVTLKEVPGEQALDLANNMDYDIQLSAWGPDYLDPYSFMSLWITDGENNLMGYSNDKYDELMEEAQNELAKPGKEQERYDNFIEAEKILFEDAAIAPVYQEFVAMLVDPKMEGVITNPIGPTYEYKWAKVN